METKKNSKNKKNKKGILGYILILVAIVMLLFMILYQNVPNWYREWLSQTPTKTIETVNKKVPVKEEKVKKPKYDYDIKPPQTAEEKMKALNTADLSGIPYLGTIRTMDLRLNTNIYQGINNEILNSGNAASYPGYDLNSGNSTLAAHTYSIYGWNNTTGFTALQKRINKGDKVYVYDGNKYYYEYVVMDKQIIDAKDGGYITDRNRYKDKKVNPSGKPMLTLYDCYEPENGQYENNPTKRNVATLHLAKKWTKKEVPKDVVDLFGGLPKYEYSEKENKVKTQENGKVKYKTVKEKIVKVKNAPRLDNTKLKFYDLLFGKLKIQNLFN